MNHVNENQIRIGSHDYLFIFVLDDNIKSANISNEHGLLRISIKYESRIEQISNVRCIEACEYEILSDIKSLTDENLDLMFEDYFLRTDGGGELYYDFVKGTYTFDYSPRNTLRDLLKHEGLGGT